MFVDSRHQPLSWEASHQLQTGKWDMKALPPVHVLGLWHSAVVVKLSQIGWGKVGGDFKH